MSIGSNLTSTSSTSSSGSASVDQAPGSGANAGPSFVETLTSACLLVSKLLNHHHETSNQSIVPISGSALAQPRQQVGVAYGPPSEANRCLKALWKPLRTLTIELKTMEKRRKRVSQTVDPSSMVDEHGVSIDERIRSGNRWPPPHHPHRAPMGDSDEEESGEYEGNSSFDPRRPHPPTRAIRRPRMSNGNDDHDEDDDDEGEEEGEGMDEGEFIDDPDEDPEDRDMRLAIQVTMTMTYLPIY